MQKRFSRLLGGMGIAALIVVADQASKMAILDRFRPAGDPEPPFFSLDRVVVSPYMDFILTWNRGVSFGLGNNGGNWNVLLFTAIAVCEVAWLLFMIAKSESKWLIAALGLIVGGAVGNVIDRLRFGAVVDFVYVHIGAFDWWPAFNIADAAICVGAGLWLLQSLFTKSNSIKNTP